jgi:hypothetical protein
MCNQISVCIACMPVSNPRPARFAGETAAASLSTSQVATPVSPLVATPASPLLVTPPPKYPVVPVVTPDPVGVPVSWLNGIV